MSKPESRRVVMFVSEFSLNDCQPLSLALLFLLYAEIHYHFKIAPSRLYRRQSEIIADAPRRLDPQRPLPLLLLIKDAHLFPLELLNVEVEITPHAIPRFKVFDAEEHIAAQWWWRVFHINLPDEIRGRVKINVTIDYRCRGKTFRCHNDNYRGTSHAPLEVFIAESPLPALPGFYHGDLHCHTNATSDQVEFGAPLPAMIALAQAQGIDFFAATDHSYDLDDFPDDYLRNDPELRKWRALQAEIERLNARHRDFVIIPGEEVSCANANAENVHFLVLDHPHFIHGRGDGGEKWLRTKPDHTIAEVLAMLGSEALAFAAHPAAPVPRLERLLLRRGHWSLADFAHARLNGLQFWNGKALGEEEGLAQWRKLLLEGRKLFAIAGNDAHGNFNRYRQIAWPCWSMAENHDHVFGHRRTVIKLNGALNLDNVLAALREGCSCTTTGPVLDLQVQCANNEVVQMGGSTNERATRATLTARSSAEFGELKHVILWRGDLNSKREEKLFECTQFPQPYAYHMKLPLIHSENPCYLRAEAVSSKPEAATSPAPAFTCLSNPIWILPYFLAPRELTILDANLL
jgi:hypothetical protein